MAEVATYETTSIGYPLKFKGPGEVEAYDRKGGKQGLCLEDAIDNTIYRSTLPEWQDAFGEKLVALYGARQVNTEQTERNRTRSKTPEKVKDVMETWTKYHNRVTAGLSETEKAALAKTAQEIADGIEVDPSPSKRQKGIPKEYKAKAESMLTLPDDQLEAKLTAWGETYPSIDMSLVERGEDGRPTVESLANVVQAIMQLRMSDL